MAGRLAGAVVAASLVLVSGVTAARDYFPALHAATLPEVVLARRSGFTLAPQPDATVTVGASANGTTIRLRQGNTLVVRLAGNPTTGYRWSVSKIPTGLRLSASSYVPSLPKRLGKGGTFVFRFKATKGSGTLRLVYARPWEKTRPPLRTFTLTVRVR